VKGSPGRFRVRYAKAENFHGASFWNGTGTYDDNSFNFAGVYTGNEKAELPGKLILKRKSSELRCLFLLNQSSANYPSSPRTFDEPA